MAVDFKFTKAVDSLISVQSENNTLKKIFEKDLVFTLCDRDDLTNNKGNYFMSFNLPYQADRLPVVSTVSITFPELQQLNVDKIIISPIPTEFYSEFIDGRTVTFFVPQIGVDGDTKSGITLISSTYTSDSPIKTESSVSFNSSSFSSPITLLK